MHKPIRIRIEFVSGRMSYIILRGRKCHIIVLNIYAPTEDEIDDVRDSFYEELELVTQNYWVSGLHPSSRILKY
jgi:hypothetical protein